MKMTGKFSESATQDIFRKEYNKDCDPRITPKKKKCAQLVCLIKSV